MKGNITPPGHLSPARAARTHKDDGAFHDAAATFRGAERMGAPWANLAPRLADVGAGPLSAPPLHGLTVAGFLAGECYSDALRFATIAARRGRFDGLRGRRRSWGTSADVAVPLPPRTSSLDDEEAAIDAIGEVWAECAAGKHGAPDAPAPIGALWCRARKLGARMSARRIRESSALLVGRSTDRAMPSDAAELTRAQLLALVPPERRGAAVRAMEAGGRAETVRRYRLPPIERPAGAVGAPGEGWHDAEAVRRNAEVDAGAP